MEGGHHLPFRVEGELCDTRIGSIGFRFGVSCFRASYHQGAFCRISYDAPELSISLLFQYSVITQNAAHQKHSEILIFGGFDLVVVKIVEISVGIVSLSVDIQLGFPDKDLSHCHFILCQSTSFIGTDDINATQSFHCKQLSDDGVPIHHFLHAQGKDDGDDSRKSFRNSSNSKADGNHEHFQEMPATDHSLDKYESANRQTDDAQIFSKLLQVLLKRCLLCFDLLDLICDLSNFCGTACPNDECLAAPICTNGAGKCHVGAVADSYITLENQSSILFGRNRLSSQGCFFDFQISTFKDSGICCNDISCFDEQDIAGHHISCRDDGNSAISDYFCIGSGHFLERFQRFLRFAFLDDAQNSIDHHDGDDDKGVCYFSDGCRYGACNQQNNDH